MTNDDDTILTNGNEAQVALKIGDRLKDRFVLEAIIGRGGMGVVYKALDLRKQETGDREPWVAIKLMSNAVRKLPQALVALQREAKKAQKLAHPNIGTVYDFDRDGEYAFMCMELLDGESLAEFLQKQSGPQTFETVRHIIEGMARGLGYAHSEKIVHSDFKPGNVFLTRQGGVKILDFGIARAFTPENSSSDYTMFDPGDLNAVTPAYASLEMFERGEPDPRDDIYALGCVCYQLLTGQHPYNKVPAWKARQENLVAPGIKNVSRRIALTLQKSVQLDRDKRLSSIAEFFDGIQPRKKVSPWRWAALIAIAVAVIGGSVAWYKISRDKLLETAIEQGDPWLSTPQAVDLDTQKKIDKLLNIADLHFAVGRYIEPPTSNAAEAYMAVLKLQPGNPRALAGTNAIVDKIGADVQLLLNAGNTGAAREKLELLAAELPGNHKLQALQKKYGL